MGAEKTAPDAVETTTQAAETPSLTIPITSSTTPDLFVEIFPEEIGDTPVNTLMQVLKDETADISLWADAALLYMQQKHPRESLTLLEEACDLPSTEKAKKVRILAATGIGHLATESQASSTQKRAGSTDPKEELRRQADQKFTQASKVDTLFPMTWVGRGILNLNTGKLDQAMFFFKTTLKQCGPVLPALLGMAAVSFGEGDYKAAQDKYAEAIRRYPKSGAATRVGFGLACYKLGQVDRAKAAFTRALELDPENVEAMVGAAILDLSSLDETARDFSSRTEKAIKMMSMANLLDHANAMVQNHLANHYFWKWTPVTGTVQVSQGSNVVRGSQQIPLDPGERIRIGSKFETTVKEDDTMDEDEGTNFMITDAWKESSASDLKVWKKDYDRVTALAKGAYSSTSVQEIQAESLFFLARVYHVREETDQAMKLYEKACKLAPDLAPARFGLAQTLIVKEDYSKARENLRRVLAMSATATDALALLGLLEVRSGKNLEEGLAHLRKAIELDPLNPDLVVMEALALRQHHVNYPKALDRYKKAVDLMKRKGVRVSYEIYANSGVLCHETKKYDEALEMYEEALAALDSGGLARAATLENVGVEGGRIRHKSNSMFHGYVDSNLQAEPTESKTVFKIVNANDVASVVVSSGDHIQWGDDFESEILSVESNDGSIILELKDAYDPMDTSEEGEQSSKPLFVKRENQLLKIPEALTIAFNIARVHEAAGRTMAAIEIHKAIIKRNPAYVNSYLRLACIAVDSGSLKECSQWLKFALETSPGNPEALTLVGNLHLSLCDWEPAQKAFDSLLSKKVPNVEAYATLSLGNIYFANLHVNEKRYAKHLMYASDFYKRILTKDPANAYAANGLGTVLAEKAEIFKAKEVFNRVREVSDDNIADALLNLGHIYLAQKKHPSALQMYKSYMKRTEDSTTPITSKSRVDDVVDVLLYIAFAYFDWARHTELFNDANAAPADGLYKEAMKHLELAISKHTKKEVVLKYDLCMTKLQAANCVLQKLTRNIPRTVEEVEEALKGLQDSLIVVEGIIKDKDDPQKARRINISSSVLQDFMKHCKANIASAESHLEDEKKRAAEVEAEREIRRLAAEAAMQEEALKQMLQKQEEAKKQEERDRKAEENVRKVEELRTRWQEEEQEAKQTDKEKKAKKQAGETEVGLEEDEVAKPGHGLFDDSEDESEGEPEEAKADESKNEDDDTPAREKDLFGDSDEEEGEEAAQQPAAESKPANKEMFGDSEEEEDEAGTKEQTESSEPKPSSKELFGDSDEDSDEELVRSDAKRANDDGDNDEGGQPKKKRRVLEDDDED